MLASRNARADHKGAIARDCGVQSATMLPRIVRPKKENQRYPPDWR
jgi:hypothetical protein